MSIKELNAPSFCYHEVLFVKELCTIFFSFVFFSRYCLREEKINFHIMLRRFLCKTSVLKVIFIVLNLLFILAGIALIVLGIYLKIDGKISAILDNLDSVSNFDGQSLGYLGFIMIAAGIIILFVAFGGCMGESSTRLSPDHCHFFFIRQ